MTVRQLLSETAKAGVQLVLNGDSLRARGPAGSVTPELKATLAALKPDVLAVLRRLDGMREVGSQTPIPCAVLDAVGGPGRCFSCGDGLEHPAAYGRCEPCQMAVELFYAERPPIDEGTVA